ncbi:MAG: YbgC/FadM family acyl-CoA thioesterase [Nitrospinota bacterium]|nr:YbgC/FadM family acyl-CoA thioesterase [Nitrospinota bacterium]
MTHKTQVDIYYEDTDCGGVVYYANYLRFFERARTRMMIDLGVDPVYWQKQGVVFAVYRAEVDYKAPAVYGDRLEIETTISGVKPTRLTFNYVVRVRGRVINTGLTKMACVGADMKPQRIPDEIEGKLTNQDG